jgi:hypothetical protein
MTASTMNGNAPCSSLRIKPSSSCEVREQPKELLHQISHAVDS